VLDAGCGEGAATVQRFADRPGVSLLGVDRSPQAVDRARGRAAGLGHLRFECCELEELAAAPGRFDLVFCALVLHLAPDPQALLEQLWSLVTPGGYLVVRGLDDGLSLTVPATPDSLAVDRLTVEVFSDVDRHHGRWLPVRLSRLPGATGLTWSTSAITTLGPGGRAAFFEVVHGWKSDPVMDARSRYPDRGAEIDELFGALDAERARFAGDGELFAATHLPVVTARRAPA
jgi:SAM-dependent methyltransferase